jgi:GxxExxY protein
MIQEELSGKIIGAAMEMLNVLRPGLDEKLYERALSLELKNRAQVVTRQRSFPVCYCGELIGNLVPDLIVDNAVIVDPKVVACFGNAQRANDWVFEHHGVRPRASDQLQKCAIGMETSVALPTERGRHPT